MKNRTQVRRAYGLEFALLFALPALVLLAGAATMRLALRDGFTPLPEVGLRLVDPR